MRFLITGGCGFLGTNLGAEVLRRGEELIVFDNLNREGSSKNLDWLKKLGDLTFFHVDIRSYNDVERVVSNTKPDVIFHLSGQVAMTTSLSDPRLDFETNVIGGHNILESVRRHVPEAIMTFSSTNKVYGDLSYIQYLETDKRYVAQGYESGFDENISIDFQSPYGCSKGAVDQYMLDYGRMFGLKTVVFRHSSIFGERQFSTYDQGWIGWFIKEALRIKGGKTREPVEISGTGKQVRDILFSSDLISCYFKSVENIKNSRANAFNIGGGVKNSLSLLELFKFLEEELDVKMPIKKLPWRVSDQKVYISNTKKALSSFNWTPTVDMVVGLRNMIDWVKESEK